MKLYFHQVDEKHFVATTTPLHNEAEALARDEVEARRMIKEALDKPAPGAMFFGDVHAKATSDAAAWKAARPEARRLADVQAEADAKANGYFCTISAQPGAPPRRSYRVDVTFAAVPLFLGFAATKEIAMGIAQEAVDRETGRA